MVLRGGTEADRISRTNSLHWVRAATGKQVGARRKPCRIVQGQFEVRRRRIHRKRERKARRETTVEERQSAVRLALQRAEAIRGIGNLGQVAKKVSRRPNRGRRALRVRCQRFAHHRSHPRDSPRGWEALQGRMYLGIDFGGNRLTLFEREVGMRLRCRQDLAGTDFAQESAVGGHDERRDRRESEREGDNPEGQCGFAPAHLSSP